MLSDTQSIWHLNTHAECFDRLKVAGYRDVAYAVTLINTREAGQTRDNCSSSTQTINFWVQSSKEFMNMVHDAKQGF